MKLDGLKRKLRDTGNRGRYTVEVITIDPREANLELASKEARAAIVREFLARLTTPYR